MKSIIVVSDTHGNKKAIDSIATQLIEADYVFHLGDINSDAQYIKSTYNANTIAVLGNCDSYTTDSEMVVEVENVKFFLCHGHKYGVKSKNGIQELQYHGEELGVNCCLFGHNHVASIDKEHSVMMINPGNMTRYSENSYCYIAVMSGKIIPKIVYLNK